ncbi:putative RNA-directed DNA polymerase from transposon BS, partial [Stegodyphus mimosarum]
MKLQTKKSPGLDGVNNKMLKNMGVLMLVKLTSIINDMLRLAHYPTPWKTAVVVPVLKPQKPATSPVSYRPISLLSSTSKVAEYIIQQRLLEHLNHNNIIISEQHGFRKKHSTNHQLYRVTEMISHGLMNKSITGAIFLDVAKAFDRVWLEGLIHKIINLGFPDYITHITYSYLMGKHFVVRVNNKISTPRPLKAGVPQGSILGPLYFNIYTNDIPQTPHTTLAMYADDTTILSQSASHGSVIQSLQDHVHALESWLQAWKIKINVEKSDAILFTRKKLIDYNIHVDMYGTPIPWTKQARYLGVVLDQCLTWTPHITQLITKFRVRKRTLSPLIARNSVLSVDNKLVIYKTMLRSIITYAGPVWSY